MQLKYHQATYNLLTKTYIDPTKAIERYDRYDEAIHQDESSTQRQKRRSMMLAWAELELFQHPVRFSDRNIKMLDALEDHYGVRIPAAVREWYSLDFVPEIMSAYERGIAVDIDGFKPLAEMEEIEASGLPDLKNDLWYFLMAEYVDQGGDYLFFSISAGDDPPVFTEYPEHNYKLIELAPTFSQFILFHFWDWYGSYMFEHSVSILYHPRWDPVFSLPARYHVPFGRLRKHYAELGGNRFYDEHTHIWAQNCHGDDGNMVDTMIGVEIRADTMEVLVETIKRLWGDDAPVFRMKGGWESEEATMLLTQLQRAQLRKVLQQSDDWIAAPDLAYQLGASIPVLSTPMAEQLTWLIEQGEVEAHPNNRDDAKSEKRFRAKRQRT